MKIRDKILQCFFLAADSIYVIKPEKSDALTIIIISKQQQDCFAAKQREQEIRKKNALELFCDIKETLDKNIKHDDQVIAFIKTQETKILSPMSIKIDKCESLLNTLVGILQSYSSK